MRKFNSNIVEDTEIETVKKVKIQTINGRTIRSVQRIYRGMFCGWNITIDGCKHHSLGCTRANAIQAVLSKLKG